MESCWSIEELEKVGKNKDKTWKDQKWTPYLYFPFSCYTISVRHHRQNDRIGRATTHVNVDWKVEKFWSWKSISRKFHSMELGWPLDNNKIYLIWKLFAKLTMLLSVLTAENWQTLADGGSDHERVGGTWRVRTKNWKQTVQSRSLF